MIYFFRFVLQSIFCIRGENVQRAEEGKRERIEEVIADHAFIVGGIAPILRAGGFRLAKRISHGKRYVL